MKNDFKVTLSSKPIRSRQLTRDGPLLRDERAGPGGCLPPPSNSAPGPFSDTHKAAIKRASKIMTKLLRSFLGQVTSGHQRSNFAGFNIFLQIGS